MAKKQSQNIIINNVNVRPPYRTRLDIRRWIEAVKSAEGTSKDRTTLLDIFHDIVTTDGHLNSVMSKRVRPVKNMQITFTKDNVPVPEINDLLKKTFFKELLKLLAETKFYGHSLIELEWYGEKFKTHLIPRKHVNPHKQIVTREERGSDGISYAEHPYCLEIGNKDELGILAVAAYYTILKRNNYGDWADFGEVYGQPFAQGTYEDDATSDLLLEAFDKAGFRRYVIAPKDAEIAYKEASSVSGAETYDKFKSAMNTEISTLILGQSMTTTEASYGGYAQGKIHKDVEAALLVDDIDDAVAELNEKLIPILARLGYPTECGEFSVINEDNLSLTERITIDTQLANIIPIDDDYYYSTYGIPKPENADKKELRQPDKQPEKSDKPKEDEPDEPQLSLTNWQKLLRFFFHKTVNLSDTYKPDGTCEVCGGTHVQLSAELSDDTIENYLRELHKGNFNMTDRVPLDLFFSYADKFREALQKGYAKSNPEYDSPHNVMKAHLRDSLFVFSAAKSLAQSREISAKLYDADGKVKPFNQFRADVDGITKLYNKSWLQTEYNNAVAQSQMAGRWTDFQERKETMPYLEYRTAGDERVRKSHQRLNRFKAPIDDKVWDTIYPPNDWNCRCNIVQTDSGRGSVAEKNIGTVPKEVVTNPLFKRNAAKEGKIFDDNHSYIKASPKLSNLDAVKNYGMKNYDKMKRELKKFPERKNTIETPEQFDEFWNSKAKNGRIEFESKLGDKLVLDEKFKNSHHVRIKKGEEDIRYIYLDRYNDIATDADEIWLNKQANEQYVYIKYYNDNAYAMVVNSKSMRVMTLHTIDNNDTALKYRTGILLLKNKNRL